MQKFYDYNPDAPFAVSGEFHDITDAHVDLDYTPKQGTVKVTIDGAAAKESKDGSPKPGEFYIDYSASTQYRMATQVVKFNAADNGKRATFNYDGVSTLIKARHFNEIRDFMNNYNADRADDLVAGRRSPRRNEKVESYAEPTLTDRTSARVTGCIGTMITLDSADGIVVGCEYTITDGVNADTFKAVSVNDENAVVTADKLTHEYSSGHLYRSTATIENGAAIAAGNIQKISWTPDATWEGTSGKTTKTIDFTKGTPDGFTVGDDGTLVLSAKPTHVFNSCAISISTSGQEMIQATSDGKANGVIFMPYIDPKIFPVCDNKISTFGDTKSILKTEMVNGRCRIHRFYVKHDKFKFSDTDVVDAIYFSTEPKDGYVLHPGFEKNGGGSWDYLEFKDDLASATTVDDDGFSAAQYLQFQVCFTARMLGCADDQEFESYPRVAGCGKGYFTDHRNMQKVTFTNPSQMSFGYWDDYHCFMPVEMKGNPPNKFVRLVETDGYPINWIHSDGNDGYLFVAIYPDKIDGGVYNLKYYGVKGGMNA